MDRQQESTLGLDEHAITELHRCTEQWADDIAERLIQAEATQDV
ncbi:hypothetical protein ACWERW_36940 [Streptomyces sp. NPDC004012]